jgi:hypothetical protein
VTTEFDIQKIISDVGDLPSTSEDINRIDPKVMTSIMAMAQAGQLARIRKNLEDRTSEGWTQSFVQNITDTQIPSEGFKFDRLAQSISLHNDGPATVFVAINHYENPSPVLFTEMFNVNFEAHKLERIFLKCPPGLAAAVRFTIKG